MGAEVNWGIYRDTLRMALRALKRNKLARR
jgi:hypothetical protein